MDGPLTHSHNPFLSRSKSVSHHPLVAASPPLPPRKAKPLLPPPKHSSQANPSFNPSLSSAKPSIHPLMQQSLLVAKASRGAMAIEKSIASQRYSQVISRSSSSTQTPTISNPVPRTNGRSRQINASSEGSSLSAHSADDSDSSHLRGTDQSATPTGRPPIPPKPKPKPLTNSTSNVRGLTKPALHPDTTSVSSYEQVAGAFEKTDSPFDSPPVSARIRATTLSNAYSDQGKDAHQIDYFLSNPPPPTTKKEEA